MRGLVACGATLAVVMKFQHDCMARGCWEIGKLGNWGMRELVTCGRIFCIVMKSLHTFGARGGWEIGKLGD